MLFSLRIVLLCLTLLAPLRAAHADLPPFIETMVTASDATANDVLGFSVAISGDTAVAGAFTKDSSTGAAYVYVRQRGLAWSQQAKLLPGETFGAQLFGYSVAISGDTIVVGQPGNDAAYVFTRTGKKWIQLQKLVASDAAPNDQFGGSVAISGDTLVVGAFAADTTGGTNAGAAYVFVRNGTTWSEQQKLIASDGSGDNSFGFVAIDGETVVVGSPGNPNLGAGYTGAAYTYARIGTLWIQQQKLTASDAAAGDQFGIAVAISGDTVVIGARADDNAGGVNAGSAYVYLRVGALWSEQQMLTASDGATGNQFGWAVAVGGDTAWVGVPLATAPAGANAGATYVFVRDGTTWTEQDGFRASGAAAGDSFGESVALDGDTAIVGAGGFDKPRRDKPPASNAGAAYVEARQQHDLAVVQLTVPKSVVLRTGTPSVTTSLTVQIQNRSTHSETINDLSGLVTVALENLKTSCTPPDATLIIGAPNKTTPLTLKSKGKLKIVFAATFDMSCVPDPAKSSTKDPGHEDFRYLATVHHDVIDGNADMHPVDDVCVRSVIPPFEIDPNPDGTIKDKGCGAKKPDGTSGADVRTDLVVK
ncbi:MAG: FG-GAP repeat protein [Deltaproteobacteria bacterium]|nr:FG-GAP repeat protein [Deltaproteobacteria bacterium]